jgi:hypothetical protein
LRYKYNRIFWLIIWLFCDTVKCWDLDNAAWCIVELYWMLEQVGYVSLHLPVMEGHCRNHRINSPRPRFGTLLYTSQIWFKGEFRFL